MSSVEKLLVQIFERKRWIVDQVKQQSDFYGQYLASTCLIKGIRPPSWLLTSGFEEDAGGGGGGTAELKELKKEDLISGLLFPLPISNHPSAAANRSFFKLQGSDTTLVTATHASDKHLEGAPELNHAIADSPPLHTGSRMPYTNNIQPHESLSKILRSRSRQKALELRNSSSKEQSIHGIGFPEPLNFSNTMNGASCRVRPSTLGTDHPNSVDKPLQPSNSVDGEDEPHNAPDSQPLIQNSTLVQKDTLMLGVNTEQHPSKGDMMDECCGRTTIQIPQVSCAEGLLQPDNFKEVSVRVTRSRSTSTNKCTQPEAPSSVVQGHDLLHSADAQLIAVLGNDGNDIVHQERCTAGVVDSDSVSNLPVECSNRITSFGVSKSLASKLPPDDDIFVEPKQLFFDEVDDCSLSGSSAHSKKEMRYGSSDKARSLDLQGDHGAQFLKRDQNLEPMNREENLRASSDAHEEHRLGFFGKEKRECDSCSTCSRDPMSLPVTSFRKGASEIDEDGLADALPERYISKQDTVELQKIAFPNNICDKGGSSVHVMLQDRVHRLEVADREKVQRAPNSCDEARFEIIEGKNECHFRPTSSSGNILNISALSSPRGTAEIYDNGGLNTSSSKHKISKEGKFSSDHSMGLNIDKRSSLGSQLQEDVVRSSINLDTDFIGLNIDKRSSLGSPLQGDVDGDSISLDRDSKKVLGATCAPKLEVGVHEVLTESSKLVSGIVGPGESLSPDLGCVSRFSFCNKHDLSSGGRQNDSIGAAAAGNRRAPTQITTPKSAQISSTRGEIPYLLRSINSMKSNKITNNASENSWPLCKRRKIEGRSSSVLTTLPRFVRLESLHQTDKSDISKFHRSAEDGLKTDLVFKRDTSSCDVKDGYSNVDERVGATLYWSGERLSTEMYGSSPRLQATEGDRDMKGGGEDVNISLGLMQTSVETSTDSSLNNEECENAQDCLSGLIDIGLAQLASEDHQNLSPPKTIPNLQKMEELGSIEGSLEDMESVTGEQLPSYCSVRSPNFEDLDLIAANQSMPEFEGFSIGLPPEQALSLSEDRISLENINLPTTTSERISVLEKLCRSNSLLTPFPQSSRHKIHRTPDVYQSLPNGLLERMDLRTAVHFSDEGFKQLKASFSLIDSELDLASYSGCMPCSGFQLEWGVGKPPHTPPPASMLNQRIASLSARHSTEKQQSVNPELTCFRIDEDTGTSEENGNLDEAVDLSHEEISPRESNSSSARRPLVDMTNTKTLPSISVTKNVHDRGSIDSVNMELCTHGAQFNAKQKHKNTCDKNRRGKKDKENQSYSVGGNGVGRAPASLYRMSPKLSRKASEGNKSQSFLGKGCKRANIVSNVSSFIPLVQQRQHPAAFATGKRDVKVKALEAAEAAKRLEEKRENDRKMRREAAKLKQLELNNKRNARKRLREEEDRKEKERKRKCIEEARRQPKEQDKLRAEKEEKELRFKADEREGKKKNLLNEERKHQKPEKGSQVAECRKNMESGTSIAKVAVENARKESDAPHDSKVSKEYHDKVGSTSLEANNCSFSFIEGCDQSYEISPYQISDDEEEDEQDVMPNKKFIPAWAREKHLESVLPSMQQVDPCKIFLPSRLCNISEVLLSRVNSK